MVGGVASNSKNKRDLGQGTLADDDTRLAWSGEDGSDEMVSPFFRRGVVLGAWSPICVFGSIQHDGR